MWKLTGERGSFGNVIKFLSNDTFHHFGDARPPSWNRKLDLTFHWELWFSISIHSLPHLNVNVGKNPHPDRYFSVESGSIWFYFLEETPQLVDSVYVFLALLWNEAMIISKLQQKPSRKYETSKRRKYKKTNTKIQNRKYKMALCSDDQVAEAAKCGRLLIESTPSAQFSII